MHDKNRDIDEQEKKERIKDSKYNKNYEDKLLEYAKRESEKEIKI